MPLSVLIIDDEIDILNVLSYELRHQGYTVFTASNGEEGYKQYLQKKPDLIILDLKLPKLTGNALCRRIRRDQSDAHTKIIMLTSLDDDADRIIGRVQGADKYLTKPFEREDLISSVKQILNT